MHLTSASLMCTGGMGVWFVCMFLWVIDACGGARYARYGALERVWFGLRTENSVWWVAGRRLEVRRNATTNSDCCFCWLLLLFESACARHQCGIVWPIIAPSGRITVQCLSLSLTLHQPASSGSRASVVANAFKNVRVRVLDSHAPVCVIFSSSFVHKFTYSLTHTVLSLMCYAIYFIQTFRWLDTARIQPPAQTSRPTDHHRHTTVDVVVLCTLYYAMLSACISSISLLSCAWQYLFTWYKMYSVCIWVQ